MSASTSPWLLVAVGASLVAISAGCGDSSVGNPDPAPPPTVAGRDRLEVQVRDFSAITTARKSPPIPGATVTIAFGSERREMKADANGLAVFEDIPLDALTSVVATAEGHAFLSRSGGNIRQRLEAYGSPTLMLLRGGCVDPDQRGCGYPSDELVGFAGSAKHLVGLKGDLVVSASVPGWVPGASGASGWSIQVPRGKSFRLFALDQAGTSDPRPEVWWNWYDLAQGLAADVAGEKTDTDGYVLDLATAPPLREVEGRFRLPEWAAKNAASPRFSFAP